MFTLNHLKCLRVCLSLTFSDDDHQIARLPYPCLYVHIDSAIFLSQNTSSCRRVGTPLLRNAEITIVTVYGSCFFTTICQSPGHTVSQVTGSCMTAVHGCLSLVTPDQDVVPPFYLVWQITRQNQRILCTISKFAESVSTHEQVKPVPRMTCTLILHVLHEEIP